MSFNKLQVFVEVTQLMVLVILMSIVTSAYSAKDFQSKTQQAPVSTWVRLTKNAIRIKDVLIGHFAIQTCANKSFRFKLAQLLTVGQNLNYVRLTIVFMNQNRNILSAIRAPSSTLAMLNNMQMNNVCTTM
jgi:hypothetical protein